MSYTGRCTARVGEPPHYFHWHQCSRRGKWLVNGNLRCNQHLQQWERNARFTGEALKVEAVPPS